MNVGVIIQARMGSTRLPGKVLKPIAGKVLLDHVLGRLSLLAYPVKVVVATSDLPQDDAIVRHCQSRSVAVYRGSETDVLDRYYQCACENGFAHVVRLTADNPFTDVEELQRLIEQHLIQHNDYTHSFGSMPLGVGRRFSHSPHWKKVCWKAMQPITASTSTNISRKIRMFLELVCWNYQQPRGALICA